MDNKLTVERDSWTVGVVRDTWRIGWQLEETVGKSVGIWKSQFVNQLVVKRDSCRDSVGSYRRPLRISWQLEETVGENQMAIGRDSWRVGWPLKEIFGRSFGS